jgi:predicted nucleic acid-binding protein
VIFVDSNVPMYVAGRDHPLKQPARRFLAKVQSGRVEAYTSTEVLQEILYRYVGLRRRDLAYQVYDFFVQLCTRVLPVTIADTDRARLLLAESATIGVRDAIHAAVMLNHGMTDVASFDRGFDDVEGITRIELS